MILVILIKFKGNLHPYTGLDNFISLDNIEVLLIKYSYLQNFVQKNELISLHSNKYQHCLLNPRDIISDYGTQFYAWTDRH